MEKEAESVVYAIKHTIFNCYKVINFSVIKWDTNDPIGRFLIPIFDVKNGKNFYHEKLYKSIVNTRSL